MTQGHTYTHSSKRPLWRLPRFPQPFVLMWKVMGLLLIFLLLFLHYLYNARISEPLERLGDADINAEAEVVTVPAMAEEVLQVPDEVSPAQLQAVPAGETVSTDEMPLN